MNVNIHGREIIIAQEENGHIQSATDKSGKNQDFKARAMRAASKKNSNF